MKFYFGDKKISKNDAERICGGKHKLAAKIEETKRDIEEGNSDHGSWFMGHGFLVIELG
jgi:hypothetical protein